MDAHALIGVQERQVLGLPGFSDIFPGFPTKSHSTSTSATSSSSSVSASASDSSTSASLTSSSSISSSSSSSSSTSSTPEVTPSTSQEFSTTTSQSTQTVIASPADASSPPSTSTAPTHTSFLQNKVLSGLVFALAGIVGLVVIISILTFVIRRKRSRRLVEDAVSFDPVKMGSGYHDALEAGRRSPPQSNATTTNYPRSSTSTGRASNGNGPEVRQAAPFADYAPLPPPHPQMYQASTTSLASYHSQQQQQQAAYIQPFNWAAPPPQQIDPYRGTSA